MAIALYFASCGAAQRPSASREIEAALDDAYVFRYAATCAISRARPVFGHPHRRGTMERADLLYGVTMQEKGVSKGIEMDVDEAEKVLT